MTLKSEIGSAKLAKLQTDRPVGRGWTTENGFHGGETAQKQEECKTKRKWVHRPKEENRKA